MKEMIDASGNAGREFFLRKYIMTRSDVFAKKGTSWYAPSYDHPDRVFTDHLTGKSTYGAYQLFDGMVKWVCYDIDDHDGQQLADIDLRCVTDQLTKHRVPFNVEKSGSRNSYHVWVFLEPAVPVEVAHNWARLQLVDRGIPVSNCEVFPKQQTGDVSFGNLVKMPFAYNRQTMRRSKFMDGNVFQVNTVDITAHVIKPLPERRSKIRQHTRSSMTTDYRGIRPCIRALVELAVPLEHYAGHRLRMAVACEYLNKGNVPEPEIAKLFAVQQDFDMEVTMGQLKSLHGYKPAKCATIKEFVTALEDTQFSIDECCSTCLLNGGR